MIPTPTQGRKPRWAKRSELSHLSGIRRQRETEGARKRRARFSFPGTHLRLFREELYFRWTESNRRRSCAHGIASTVEGITKRLRTESRKTVISRLEIASRSAIFAPLEMAVDAGDTCTRSLDTSSAKRTDSLSSPQNKQRAERRMKR